MKPKMRFMIESEDWEPPEAIEVEKWETITLTYRLSLGGRQLSPRRRAETKRDLLEMMERRLDAFFAGIVYRA